MRVLVYGASGAVGRSLVGFFAGKNYSVLAVGTSADLGSESKVPYLQINKFDDMEAQRAAIAAFLDQHLAGTRLNAIITPAGGFVMENYKSKDLVPHFNTTIRQSVFPAVVSISLAESHLEEAGLCVVFGSQAASSHSPAMLAYGTAKASVHYLFQSLTNTSPKTFLCLAPGTIDTPANRSAMPTADTSAWTPLGHIEGILDQWTTQPGARPPTGSIIDPASVQI